MVQDELNEDPNGERPTLSVVLPAYRAAEILAQEAPLLVAALGDLGVSSEVVVCDDGSDDDGATEAVAGDLGFRYVGHETNRGKGAAVRTGMLAARGRYRLFTDADIPFELDVIEVALRALSEEGVPVVAGDRTLATSHYYLDVSRVRRMGSQVYGSITGKLVMGGDYDTQCGFKGFRGDVAEELFRVARIDRFASDVELIHLALRRGHEIKRLPVRLRNEGTSSVRVVRDGVKMLWDLLRIRYHSRRGHYDAEASVADNGLPEETT